MNAEFWIERWNQHQIGFHQKEINSYLTSMWSQTNLPIDSGILVPLCGKSLDMLWLADQKYRVVGIELSEVAASEFCAENSFLTTPQSIEGGYLWKFNSAISFICKDFFKVTAADTGKINGVYDRAALVALPPEMRKTYASHVTSLLEKGGKIFLVTFEYSQDKMKGPPFSVTKDEVSQLYGHDFIIDEITKVELKDQSRLAALPENEKILERVYILEKK
ncbi:MAG: thiopurine S-methyltransferase [Spirochaetia bacterium]|nr:thiopurine S-methyltransferase [Spirochaetia bacterium]